MHNLSTVSARIRASRPTQFVRRPRTTLIVIAIGFAVLVGCMFLVRNGDVGNTERSIFRTINGLPDALKAPMWVFQLFGSLVFVGLAALFAFGLKRARLGIALLMAIPLKLAFEWWVVKALVERERPLLSVPDAVIREVNSSPLGFPSGHAIFAFVMAGCLTPYVDRRGAVVLYLLAGMNGIARIYLGAHSPLDVIAGAALGVAIAACINLIVASPS